MLGLSSPVPSTASTFVMLAFGRVVIVFYLLKAPAAPEPAGAGSQMGLTVEVYMEGVEDDFEEECAAVDSMLALMNHPYHLEENDHLHACLQGLPESK